jgi:hypothetical protein
MRAELLLESPGCLLTLRRYLNPFKLNGGLPLAGTAHDRKFHSAAGKTGGDAPGHCPKQTGKVEYPAAQAGVAQWQSCSFPSY